MLQGLIYSLVSPSPTFNIFIPHSPAQEQASYLGFN